VFFCLHLSINFVKYQTMHLMISKCWELRQCRLKESSKVCVKYLSFTKRPGNCVNRLIHNPVFIMSLFPGSWSINLTKTIRMIKQVLKVCFNRSLYLKRWCREKELSHWPWIKLEQSGSTWLFCYLTAKHR